jgi:hypothetical protein
MMLKTNGAQWVFCGVLPVVLAARKTKKSTTKRLPLRLSVRQRNFVRHRVHRSRGLTAKGQPDNLIALAVRPQRR